MSEQYVLDRRELPGLLQAVEGEVSEVLGDGAYDFQDCYKAIHARGGAGRNPATAEGAGQRRAGVRGQERGRAAGARSRAG
jgi:hypothetical protein